MWIGKAWSTAYVDEHFHDVYCWRDFNSCCNLCCPAIILYCTFIFPSGGIKMAEEQENVIYVGNKPPMNYVLAAITQLNSGVNQVAIKARGRAISRAVDVAEIVRRRFVTDAQIKDVKIYTEELTNEEGNKINVSCIEIYLARE